MTTTRKRSRKITDRPNVAVIYVRVSRSQQVDGLSLDHQERTLRAAAELAGYESAILFREEGKPAGSMMNRPELRKALEVLRAGDAAALYVLKVDRLARSTMDALVIAELAQKQGWRLVALDLGLDTSTPVGKLVLSVLAAAAEMERERISERHRDWHAEKRARGITWGKDEGPKALLPDEVRQRIAAEHQEGRSLRAIAAGLNAEEIPTARGGRWHASTVRAILGSPSLPVAA